MKMYECEIVIKLNPRREANSRKEFIENLVKEYNDAVDVALDMSLDVIDQEDIINIKEDV